MLRRPEDMTTEGVEQDGRVKGLVMFLLLPLV